MSIESKLKSEAIQFARHFNGRSQRIRKELEDLKARARDLEVEIANAAAAQERAQNFIARTGSDFQCPVCWVERDAKIKLSQSENLDENDTFRCSTCGFEGSFAP
jgi:predicted RNA-binding Zn-ribbon protein involved in translation (DUF1610 family)